MAAVLGGANSLHTNSLDEALALPTKEAALLALRTQQVIAHESGVTEAVDPLGGSYWVESLTRDLEAGARDYFDRIDARGGMVSAIEQGFPQQEIANSAYAAQQAVESGAQEVVGVNSHVEAANRAPVDTLYIDESAAAAQAGQVGEIRARRNQAACQRALDRVRRTAEGTGNLMPPLIDAVRVEATLGELCDALRDVWGEWEETPRV